MCRIFGSRAVTLVIPVSFLLAGCGGGGRSANPVTGPTPAPVLASTSGQVSDPAGDAVPDPRLVPVPDLVSATVQVSGDEVRIAVRFAPGTFDQATTWLQIMMDTDESTSTGLRGVDTDSTDASLMGVDYVLDRAAQGLVNPRQALLRCATSNFGDCTSAGAFTTVPQQDGVDYTLTRTSIGNDDGRMRVKVVSFAGLVGVGALDEALDLMPDAGLTPMRVQ